MPNPKCHQQPPLSAGYLSFRRYYFFFPVQENCISLPGSNSSGNPSASSVITGLLRQSTHSALTVESQVLRSALFVRWWLRRTFKIFSVFLFPLKPERLKPLALLWVPLTLCLLGLSSWFWKACVSGALYLQLHSQWSPSCPCFFVVIFFHSHVIRVRFFQTRMNRTGVHTVITFQFTC